MMVIQIWWSWKFMANHGASLLLISAASTKKIFQVSLSRKRIYESFYINAHFWSSSGMTWSESSNDVTHCFCSCCLLLWFFSLHPVSASCSESLWLRDGYSRCRLIIYQSQHQWEIILLCSSLPSVEVNVQPIPEPITLPLPGWINSEEGDDRNTDRQWDRQTETKRDGEKEEQRDRERESQRKGKESFPEYRMVSLINHLFFQFISKVWCNTRSIVHIQYI